MLCAQKKKRTHAEPDPEADAKVPKSIVYKSGKVGRSIAHLVHDMRKVMSPYTAERLQVHTLFLLYQSDLFSHVSWLVLCTGIQEKSIEGFSGCCQYAWCHAHDELFTI
jgi:hypothetical protein